MLEILTVICKVHIYVKHRLFLSYILTQVPLDYFTYFLTDFKRLCYVSLVKAMHLLEAVVNLIYICDYLGHVSVTTTAWNNSFIRTYALATTCS